MIWPFKRRREQRQAAPQDMWGTLAADTINVSPQAAESLSAVLGGVQLISDTIAALPCNVYRLAKAGREEAPSSPLQRLIDNGPSPLLTWFDWVGNSVADLLLRGNCFSSLATNVNGLLMGLDFVPWRQVGVIVHANGDMIYTATPSFAGKTQRFIADEVLHIRMRSDDGGFFGRSPLSRGANVLQTSLETQTQARQFFKNQARPSGALTAPGKLSDATTKRLQESWDDNYSGERLGKTAVLPEGLKWEAISFSPQDAETLGNRKLTVLEICRILGIPPFLLAEVERGASFASSKEAVRMFARSAIAPMCERLEQAIGRACLPPGYEIEFDLDQLLRADPELRWSTYQIARNIGAMSTNEIRYAEGFNPLSDASADSHEPLNQSPQAAGTVSPARPLSNGHDPEPPPEQTA